ncbi:MAG: GH32 C-terminal domain-containing protein [Paludibacteraceae bacterium]
MKKITHPLFSICFMFVALTVMGAPIDNSSNGLKTNLNTLDFDKGTWLVTEDGLNSNLSGMGDGFALSTSKAYNFVYEVDVTFNNRNESAASLVLGSNNNLGEKNMYVANIHAHNGVARLFKFQHNSRGTEAFDLVSQKTIPLTNDNKYHLSVTVIGKHIVFSINGQLIANTADYTNGGVYGQNDAFIDHNLGLLSWNANCVYQNLYFNELSEVADPQLTNIGLEALTGTIEHNVVFDPTQFVSISHVSNDAEEVKINFSKKSNTTITTVKLNDITYSDNTIPLQVGTNIATISCENKNAKVIYRLIIIRRKSPDLYYNEFDRGQYHFSVKQGWTNDPNGMVYYNGEYHLFHQFYHGINWGPMHWGHSVSKDMIHWEELPIAFYPDEYGTMFSGSAVVDEGNTSGLFLEEDGKKSATGGLVAIITADGNGERVIIAYSKDGRSWKKHEGVVLDWTEDPLFDRAFRDPKVFRYQNKWFMVIAGGPLRIYSSDNLIDWQNESTYSDQNFECPDMFRLPVVNGEPDEHKWVLSKGGLHYRVGDLKQVEGKWRFVPDSQYEGAGTTNDGIMNFGNDAYATQTYYKSSFDVPQRVVEISWMNFRAPNLGKENGNQVFNGVFTLQSELSLIKDVSGKYLLQQTPITEYESLRDIDASFPVNSVVDATKSLDFSGDSYEIVADFTLNGATEVGFNVRVGDGYYTRISYNAITGIYTIDKRKTGMGPDYYLQRYSKQANLPIADGKVKLHIFVDRNTVELFANERTIVGSSLIYPPLDCNGVEVFSIGGSANVNAKLYPMKSIWEKSTAEPTAENKNYTHLIMYGQSLSTGHEAWTNVSTENIPGNYMLGKQVWANYGNYDMIEINPLEGHPAIEMSNDIIETPILGAANHIQKKGLESSIIATSTGNSGKSIEDLSKESQVHNLYDVFTQTLKFGRRATERVKSTIYCPAIFWMQGEWNYTVEGSGLLPGTSPTSSKDEYRQLLLQLKNNIQADVKTIYNQTEKPVFYTYQTGAQYTRGRTISIGMAQLEASNEHDDIICTGPTYPMTDYGGHLDANGYRWYGEMLGKIYYKHKILHEDFKPLQPKKIFRDANNDKRIIIQYHVPVPPLVLDEKTLPKEANYGFEIYMRRVNQTIQSVSILNENSVEIICTNPLTEDIEVIYGSESTRGHGNLRDSDKYPAAFNYVDIDKKDDNGNYIYPRRDNRSLRPAYEPKDENDNIIYDKPYPLFNFSIAFNYLLKKGENELDIPMDLNDIQAYNNGIDIIQTGKILRIKTANPTKVGVKIFDIAGKMQKDFGFQQKNEFFLSSLSKGVYIVSVTTQEGSLNQKIQL